MAQYAPPVAAQFGDLATVPEEFLLWFHHVPWDHRMASGNTLWDELVLRYGRGVDYVAGMRRTWDGLAGKVDPERHAQVAAFLAIQEKEAQWWRDASIAYFQTFSKRPLPAGEPAHAIDYRLRREYLAEGGNVEFWSWCGIGRVGWHRLIRKKQKTAEERRIRRR